MPGDPGHPGVPEPAPPVEPPTPNPDVPEPDPKGPETPDEPLEPEPHIPPGTDPGYGATHTARHLVRARVLGEHGVPARREGVGYKASKALLCNESTHRT